MRVRFLNAVAVRGLALFDDPAIGKTLAANYRAFHPSERGAVIDTLATRPAFARALLDQMAAGKIPRQDLTAFHARQIRSLGDPGVDWPACPRSGASCATRPPTPGAGRQAQGPARRRRAGRGRSRAGGAAAFERVCASCHKLYGRGGEIGPDLTGAGRDNLDYLLENIVDPAHSVSADFRMSRRGDARRPRAQRAGARPRPITR